MPVWNQRLGWTCAVAFGLCFPMAVVAAQSARGLVRDSASGRPLAGAVVLVLDTTGHVVARTMTNSAGRFNTARSFGLRIVRIGYSPRDVAASAVRDFIDVSMVRVPAVLDAFRITSRAVCRSGADDGGFNPWLLWNQVRAGLLGAVVAAVANPVTATTTTYRRRVGRSDHRIRRQSTESHVGLAVRPFAAASTDRFARLGYVDEDSTGRTYYAPDAEVLLDESFAATHCFAVRLGDAEHPDQIGLAFTPTPERDTLVEISGTLWVDRAITALRSLEFRYTALEPAAMRSDAGGDLTFRSVGNGVAFVERWSLRLPVLIPAVGDPPLTGLTESRLRTSNSRLRVAEVEEAGGMVTEARWRDGTVWMARPVGLTGVVRESTSDSPVPGALVSLVESSGSTVSDRVGAFTLTPLVPGHYTLAVTDTTLSMVTIPRRATFDVEVKPDQLIHVSPRVESIDALIPRVCDRALGGTVNDVRLIAGRLALLPDTLGAGPPLLNALMATDRDTISVELTVDSRGRFVACAPQGVHDALLRLSLRTFAADTSISPGPTRVTSFEWRPTFRLVSRQATARSVRGVVLDSAGRPLARVTVSAAGATVPPAVSDDSGAFRLRLANRDAIVLDFRRVAFAPARFGLGAGGDTILTVTLLPTVQRLEGVTVTDAPPTSANLRGFEERLRKRARGILGGTFITEEQIEKRNPTQVTQLFLDIPSVRVLRVNPLYQRYSIFGVSRQMGDRGPAMCPAAVYIDGIRALEGGDDLGTKERQTGGSVRDVREAGVAINDLVLPSQIKGIEVYTNSMDVPPQYQSLNGGCIVVLVWTK